jgi:hypothetical protein
MATHHTKFVLAQHYFRVPMMTTTDNYITISGRSQRVLRSRHDRTTTKTEGTAQVDDGDENEDPLMRLWYVSKPFEVVCIQEASDDEEEFTSDRPRPLVAVDFGHAVWIEYTDAITHPTGGEAKWLRFVTFPSVCEDTSSIDTSRSEGTVRTLEVPDELDLDNVETINIDQSQGAVILSVKEGKIFILCYE